METARFICTQPVEGIPVLKYANEDDTSQYTIFAVAMPNKVVKVSDTEVQFVFSAGTVTVTAESNDGTTVSGLSATIA